MDDWTLRDKQDTLRTKTPEDRLKLIWQWSKDGSINLRQFRALVDGYKAPTCYRECPSYNKNMCGLECEDNS